jgi:hypothetical protein
MIPVDGEIVLRTNDGPAELCDLVTGRKTDIKHEEIHQVQELEITACVVQLPFTVDSAPLVDDPHNTMAIILPLHDNSEVVIRPYMDKAVSEIDCSNRLLSLVIEKKTAEHRYGPPTVILIEPHDDHYERIGYFQFFNRYDPVRTKSDRYTFRTRSAAGTQGDKERRAWVWFEDAKEERIILRRGLARSV